MRNTNRKSRIMTIRQRWYRLHQFSNQSNNQPLLHRLFDISSVTSRMLALYDNDHILPVLLQNWQILKPDLVKIHSALLNPVLMSSDGGLIDDKFV